MSIRTGTEPARTGPARRASLRERQSQHVQALLVQGFLDAAAVREPAEVSMTRVAAEAGVSLRTVHRHFARRQDLVRAALARATQEAGPPLAKDTPEALHEHLAARAAAFAARPGLARSLRALEAATLERARTSPHLAALARRALPSRDHAAARKVAALLDHLLSASAWTCLVERWGLEPAEAGPALSWAAEALLHAPERRGPGGARRADDATSSRRARSKKAKKG